MGVGGNLSFKDKLLLCGMFVSEGMVEGKLRARRSGIE